MRPLTAKRPKPLLSVGGRPLIEHHILNLKAAGFDDLIVNVSYLGEQIADFCGDGSQWGVSITLSHEGQPLETAGGIVKALPWLSSGPFMVVNSDVYTDYPFALLRARQLGAASAHLVLVDNPPHHELGDFLLDYDSTHIGQPNSDTDKVDSTLTFSGIALYNPAFFAGLSQDKLPLKPLLDRAITQGSLTGEHYRGFWMDIGTPERLEALNHQLVTQ